MSMNTFPMVETGFYFDDIACAYMVRGIMKEKLASGFFSAEDIDGQEHLVLQMPDEDFKATAKDERLRKGLPALFCNSSELYELADHHKDLELCFISEFDGEIKTNSDICGSDKSGIEETLSEAYVVFLALNRESSLLHAAYNNVDEVVEEIKTKIGSYFPADFDFASRICDIQGTTFC